MWRLSPFNIFVKKNKAKSKETANATNIEGEKIPEKVSDGISETSKFKINSENQMEITR